MNKFIFKMGKNKKPPALKQVVHVFKEQRPKGISFKN